MKDERTKLLQLHVPDKLFSYALNFFLDKLAFDCDILRNFAMCNLSLNKRWINICQINTKVVPDTNLGVLV